MKFEDFKAKVFAERPGLKEEYEKIDRERLYVLGRNDPVCGDTVFYNQNTSLYNGDTTNPIKASKYGFDEAAKKARTLREFGLRYRVMLLDSLL